MPSSHSERSLRARIGAHALHAHGGYDSRELTAPARAAFLDRFARQVDPENILSEAERDRRAAHARKAYMLGLSLKSAKARAAKKGGAK